MSNVINFSLVALKHPEIAYQCRLTAGQPATFGRDSRAANILNAGDGKLSGCHMQASWDGNRLTITDMRSTNGTSVNGTRCTPGQPVPVKDGDVITMGSYEYRVAIRAAQQAAPAAAAAPVYQPPVQVNIPEPEKKKSPLIPILAVLAALIVIAVVCFFTIHSYSDATCTAAAKCKICGKESGGPADHAWSAASCTDARRCSICGVTDGEALGHTWAAASCEEARKCSVCEIEDGEPMGHTWTAANCVSARRCSVCNITDGVQLGHAWLAPSCVSPATCSRCGIREGSALGHNWVEATCTEPRFCRRCEEIDGDPLGHTVVEATCTEASYCSVCEEILAEANGHDWAEATYEKPATCKVCSAETGNVRGWIGDLKGKAEIADMGTYSGLDVLYLDTPVDGMMHLKVTLDVSMKAGARVEEWEVMYRDKFGEWNRLCIVNLPGGNGHVEQEFVATDNFCPYVTALTIRPTTAGSYSWNSTVSYSEVQGKNN